MVFLVHLRHFIPAASTFVAQSPNFRYPTSMPTIFRQDGFRAFFYSNEGDPREPPHVHVITGAAEAKFWLQPAVTLATSVGFDARMLRRSTLIIEARRDEIERAWHDYFG